MAVPLPSAAGLAEQPRNPLQSAPGAPGGQISPEAILVAALEYAATTGKPVFFVSAAKMPLKGSHGHKDATADPAKIRELFRKHPGGVGVGAPVPDGEFVLDVDVRSGGDRSLENLIRENEPLPPTVTTLTPGGQHLRFKIPPSVKINSRHSKLGPGLDVKAAGQGYVVLPPSPHPSGGVYRWKPFCAPEEQTVAEAPPWMLALLTEKPREPGKTGKGSGRDYAEWLSGIPQGQPGGRDWFIYQFACRLRRDGIPYDGARVLVLEAARRCRPPFPEARATEKLDRAYRFEAGDSDLPTDDREWPAFVAAPTKWPEEVEPGLVGAKLDDWEPEAGDGEPAASETSTPNSCRPKIRVRTARQIAEDTPATPNWTAKPWVPAGGMTEVTGKIKVAGKTTWVTNLCRQVLDGQPFMGEPTTASPVVYLTEQTDTSFREALRRAGLTDRDDFHVIAWRDTVGLEWPEVVRQAVAVAKETSAKLLIVDTLPQFAGLAGDAENSSGDAMTSLKPLQVAAGDGLSVVTVRHDRKSGGEVGDSARGSTAFGGGMDVVISIRRPAGAHRETIRQIDALSRFDETPGSLVIEKTATGYVALGSMAAMAEAEADAAMRDVMPATEEEAKEFKELLEAANDREDGRKVTRTNGYLAVKRLLKAGTARRTGRGGKGDPYRYWCPREAEEGEADAPLF